MQFVNNILFVFMIIML